MKLVLASQNKGKTMEIASLLPHAIRVQTLKESGVDGELDEPFETLEENSMAKARQALAATGLPSFADDTGLEIDALDGRPGVYAARFAGPDKDPEANMNKVLEELQGKKMRAARFRTVIAFTDGKVERLFQGVIHGDIAYEKRGTKGFGYDPVFIPEGNSRTFAEMELDEKNRFSHRAMAVKAFVAFIRVHWNLH
jgi:XTP/dITP diphosphohydrolase